MHARSLRFAADTCRSCGQVQPEGELDDHRWCPVCRERLELRVRRGQYVIAILIVLPFAVWIFVLEHSAFLPRYAWLIPLAAAYYLGRRIGREALKGWARWRREKG